MNSQNPSLDKKSKRQPVWHVIVLVVFSCGAYFFYWFYKTWRDLANEASKSSNIDDSELKPFHNISPVLRTFGILVPIVSIYIAFGLFKSLAKLHPDQKSIIHRHPTYAATILVLLLTAFSLFAKLNGTLALLGLSIALPIAISQSWLNAYWQSKESADSAVCYAFSGYELILLILGSLLLGLVAASSLLIPQN